MFNEKIDLVELAKRSYNRYLISGANGNFTIKSEYGYLYTTPMGKCLGYLHEDEVIVTSLKRKIIENIYNENKPSVEFYNLHLPVFKSRTDINTVSHVHPPNVISLSIINNEVSKPLLTDLVLNFINIPIAPCYNLLSDNLFDSVKDLILNNDCIIMKNHGLLVLGKNWEDAYNKSDLCERIAQVFILTGKYGKLNEISKEEVSELLESKKKLFEYKNSKDNTIFEGDNVNLGEFELNKDKYKNYKQYVEDIKRIAEEITIKIIENKYF